MTGDQIEREGALPVFMLSFRQRDELTAMLVRAGWQPVAARRSDGAERRFLASGAALAIIDARGALPEGLAATEALAGAVAARGGVLLVMVSRGMADRLDDFLSAGATHFVTSPISELEFIQAVRFAEAQARRTMDGRVPAAPLGWRLDPANGSVRLTPALARRLACSVEERPAALLHRLAAADRAALYDGLRRLRDGEVATALTHGGPDGDRFAVHLQRTTGHREIDALVEPLGDIADAQTAMRDALTGAQDAAGCKRWLTSHMADARIGVIMVGITRFAVVNAAYGRATGDALLRTVSRAIADALGDIPGEEPLVGRIGGSDFMVATTAGHEHVELAGEAVERAIARATVAEKVSVGVSLVSLRSDDGEAVDAFLRRAAEALADAREGKTAPEEADDASRGHRSVEQLAIDLHSALEAGQIDVVFQPQVAIATGRIVGVEALARWRHPRLGELGAETLFAAANRAGLGIALSDEVQRRALTLAANWPKVLGDLRLSINITSEDVARAGFADILLDRVDSSGFPRSRLTFEITETGLMEDLGAAARLLSQLRNSGCRVAIDDFGTGYSSLAYLKALPLDYLKIDRKLSQDITGTPRDRVVVRGVIDMARSLGLSVIAEGVETEEQLDLLAKEGCQYYQGFLCARPLVTDELAALLDKGEAA